MEFLDISKVKPGMRLARAVFSHEGKLLLPPGEVLQDAHLALLKDWKIQAVTIEAQSSEPYTEQAQQGPEDLMEAIRQSVMERFIYVDIAEPHIQTLFDLAVERQGRLFLSYPGKIALNKAMPPAFQTPRPPKSSLKLLIESSHRIGTLPLVFHRLVDVLNNDKSTIEEISQIIATDTALTARLLRLVNSPFYGLAYTIDTISRAVVMVGTRQLVILAMGATLLTTFRGLPLSLINMQSFWSHSLSTGAASRILARHAGLPQAESFFVAGLLHDIAKLLIYTQLPKHALYMMTEAKRQKQLVHSLEEETLGFTHEKLGEALLDLWRCPHDLVERVAKHHSSLSEASPVEELILPTANLLSQSLGYGSSGEIFLPPLPAKVWERLDMSLESLHHICRQLDESVRSLRALFTPPRQS